MLDVFARACEGRTRISSWNVLSVFDMRGLLVQRTVDFCWRAETDRKPVKPLNDRWPRCDLSFSDDAYLYVSERVLYSPRFIEFRVTTRRCRRRTGVKSTRDRTVDSEHATCSISSVKNDQLWHGASGCGRLLLILMSAIVLNDWCVGLSIFLITAAYCSGCRYF